ARSARSDNWQISIPAILAILAIPASASPWFFVYLSFPWPVFGDDLAPPHWCRLEQQYLRLPRLPETEDRRRQLWRRTLERSRPGLPEYVGRAASGRPRLQ